MVHLQEVPVGVSDLERFTPLIGADRIGQLRSLISTSRDIFAGRTVWNVNSTATGGGVAEMLAALLPYARGAGVDTRWLVIKGDPAFYAITKRLHNGLHGVDTGPLGDAERDHYAEVTAANAAELLAQIRPGDVVLLHDPQTAGMVDAARSGGAKVVWRCHIGVDEPNAVVAATWGFLQPFLAKADRFVFSRAAHVPAWAPPDSVHIVPPSIDPFAVKNAEMSAGAVRAIVASIGLVATDGATEMPTFQRRDGSPGRVDHLADIIRTGPPPPPEAPLVVQVSRWDRLKDMAGVMQAFAQHVDPATGAHLALVGPNVSGVADDPEGGEVLAECQKQWRELPHAERARIQLVCLPMYDLEENAAIVNAVQRSAAVVVQKSLAEGFGLTVAEAMWKARPMVASAVGGISDQIVDERSGLLVADPTDLATTGAQLNRILGDPELARRLGAAAKARIGEHFLGERHLRQYAQLLATLLD